jgi:hypothetical protein
MPHRRRGFTHRVCPSTHAYLNFPPISYAIAFDLFRFDFFRETNHSHRQANGLSCSSANNDLHPLFRSAIILTIAFECTGGFYSKRHRSYRDSLPKYLLTALSLHHPISDRPCKSPLLPPALMITSGLRPTPAGWGGAY